MDAATVTALVRELGTQITGTLNRRELAQEQVPPPLPLPVYPMKSDLRFSHFRWNGW